MAIKIIPDRICSHCGGNKWYVSYVNRKNGEVYTKYHCIVKRLENCKRYNKNHYDDIRTFNKKGGKYYERRYKKSHDKYTESIKNLDDSYVKVRAAHSLEKRYKDVTFEEIQKKREELIKVREYKKIPYIERRREQFAKHHVKRRDTINDAYVKSVIRNTLRQKTDNLPSSDEISRYQVLKTRASIIARRQNKSDSYIRTIIQTSIKQQTGETVSFNNIPITKIRHYRIALRKVRYAKALQKLIIN